MVSQWNKLDDVYTGTANEVEPVLISPPFTETSRDLVGKWVWWMVGVPAPASDKGE